MQQPSLLRKSSKWARHSGVQLLDDNTPEHFSPDEIDGNDPQRVLFSFFAHLENCDRIFLEVYMSSITNNSIVKLSLCVAR